MEILDEPQANMNKIKPAKPFYEAVVRHEHNLPTCNKSAVVEEEKMERMKSEHMKDVPLTPPALQHVSVKTEQVLVATTTRPL
jgi:hypothetical protein